VQLRIPDPDYCMCASGS